QPGLARGPAVLFSIYCPIRTGFCYPFPNEELFPFFSPSFWCRRDPSGSSIRFIDRTNDERPASAKNVGPNDDPDGCRDANRHGTRLAAINAGQDNHGRTEGTDRRVSKK